MPSNDLVVYSDINEQIKNARAERDFDALANSHQLFNSSRGVLGDTQYYKLMMALCYAYMQFGDYEQAGSLVATHLAALQRWQPTGDGLETKANLFHIYGQNLTREGRIADAIGYFLDAEAMFASIDAQHPSLFSIQVILGEAFLTASLYDKALASFNQSILLKPPERTDGVSYLVGKQVRAYLGAGDVAMARSLLNEYMFDPVDPRIDYYLYFQLANGKTLLVEERFETVLQLYNVVLPTLMRQRDTALKSQWLALAGQAELALGNWAAAEASLTQALKDLSASAYIENLQVYESLIELYEQQARWQEALTMSQLLQNAQQQLFTLANQVRIAELDAVRSLQQAEQARTIAEAEVALLASQNQQARLLFWLTATGALILAILVVVLIFQWRRIHQRNQMLAKFGFEDYLTGLGNRRAFQQALNDSHGMQLAIVDLDGLKRINDENGHDMGDKLITKFAKALRTALYATDGKAFRIGGDEFAVLLGQAYCIDSIIAQVISRVRMAGFEQADASYGSTIFDGNVSHCMTIADAAMYRMKSQRKTARTSR
ncbi:GGDEF domain-containing protein [Salinibius halmophilus]|uniref:GGDEF domain-containing protein n=1 Tax=Salinibius halmophilus TaxID=1853216 RepID=UPI0013143904|nr:GGDEF domain-containing protein [Salinibius halmophilus]